VFDAYLITDGPDPETVVKAVQQALRAAPRKGLRVAVQLRAKSWPHEELVRAGRMLRAVTREANVPLFVSSNIVAARVVQADGVHLPENATTVEDVHIGLGPHALVGRSCHDAAGLARAAAERASFATLSPVYPVKGKGPTLGVDAFERLVRDARLPVLALGGIGPAEVPAVIAAGARGVAVRSNVLHATDPTSALSALLDALDAARVLDTARNASGRSYDA
jgi:thiamine-phosphate diphosphorylase